MNVGLLESMSDALDWLPAEPWHIRPNQCTVQHGRLRCCCILICIYMQNNSQLHNDKGRAKTSLENMYLSFYCNVCVWEGAGDEQRHSRVSFSFCWCSTGGPEAQLSAGFLYHILSPASLVPNSLISNSFGGPEGPFCWVVAFTTTSCL